MSELLRIENLSIDIKGQDEKRSLVSNLSLDVNALETVALVGGSGGGKTTIGLAILQLLSPAMQITSGKIFFDGKDLLECREKQMQKMRGKKIAMVFQEPLSAFNPVFRIGNQIAEVLQFHTRLNQRQIREKVFELLDLVEVPDPKRVASYYPHQLSGGLRQRAMIAQAIAGNPELIIADEPTSNLDVTIQARILSLFKKIKNELNISMLLITHDLGVVRFLAERVFVLDQGCIIESGCVSDVFDCPQQDFTKKLMELA
ncbi:MAG: ABC transporter ATP-binding protein [Candidatus Omnitrophica bacterium]|nr:ABC transporter ATP-binding protein [Candidatus Omnitrophota bacterium]